VKKNATFFRQTPWSWQELMKLLLLVLVIVPIFIEYLLKGYLSNILQNELYSGTFVGLVMAIIFTAGLYVIAMKPNKLSWQEVGLKRFSPQYWPSLVGWTFVLIVISVAMVVVMELLLGVGPENNKLESLQSRITPINFLIAFVSAAIISPIYEEIFYRGFLYRFLRGKFGIAISLFISSFIFMIVHIPTFNTLPVNFVGGLIFAWTYEKSGSIIPAILIHSLFNGIAVILTSLG
jgi:uncharacterized protein